MQVNSVNNHIVNLEVIKNVGINAVKVLAWAVFVVAHPIFGLIGSFAYKLSAYYHKERANYYCKLTRDKGEDRNLIPGTELKLKRDYINLTEGKFSDKDVYRLYNEKQRLLHEKAAEESLIKANYLIVCFYLPVIGLFWAAYEMWNTPENSYYGLAEKLIDKHIEFINAKPSKA
jgi:hypothetical protein